MRPFKQISAFVAVTSGVVGILRAIRTNGTVSAAVVTHDPGSYYQSISRQWGFDAEAICQLATVGP